MSAEPPGLTSGGAAATGAAAVGANAAGVGALVAAAAGFEVPPSKYSIAELVFCVPAPRAEGGAAAPPRPPSGVVVGLVPPRRRLAAIFEPREGDGRASAIQRATLKIARRQCNGRLRSEMQSTLLLLRVCAVAALQLTPPLRDHRVLGPVFAAAERAVTESTGTGDAVRHRRLGVGHMV